MLPFPHAHWFVGFYLIVTFAAFAPSYFIVLPDAPWVHHLHGITATLWIVLLMTQNVTAHRRRWRGYDPRGCYGRALRSQPDLRAARDQKAAPAF